MTRQDEYKRLAGRRGAEEVKDGMLVGLGTGDDAADDPPAEVG